MSKVVEDEVAVCPGPCASHEFEGREYTQEAGKDVECISSIPREEELNTDSSEEVEPYSLFHDVSEKFYNLHPYEQNEILINTLKIRKKDMVSLNKELDNKTKMYYPDDLLQLLFPNI